MIGVAACLTNQVMMVKRERDREKYEKIKVCVYDSHGRLALVQRSSQRLGEVTSAGAGQEHNGLPQ